MSPRRCAVEEDESSIARMQQRIDALTQQMAVIVATLQQHNQPQVHTLWRRGKFQMMRKTMVPEIDSRRWEFGLKVDIPEFQDNLKPEEFLVLD
jgi:hypothetical protein